MTSRNPKNIHWWNLSPFRKDPLLPHAHIYRQALESLIGPGDLSALDQFSLHFLMSTSPKWIGGAAGAALGLSIYGLEKRLHNPIHPKWPTRAGFRPIIGRAADCETTSDLVDLIMAASCVPPVMPGGRYENQNVLDGGLVDNVPTLLAQDEPGNTLVLLSRRYGGELPSKKRTVYAQPSVQIKIDKFDYANPEGLQQAFELGLADGGRFAVAGDAYAHRFKIALPTE